MKYLAKLIETALLLLAAIAVLALLSSLLFGWKPDIILSNSMSPTLESGDLAIVVPSEVEEIEEGSVICFISPLDGHSLCHRVVEIGIRGGNRFFRTQGDANDSRDPFAVPTENVRGRTVVRIPKLGFLILALKSPWGFVFGLLIPALIIIADEIWKIIKDRKMKRAG